jgi:hypothetical protein
VAANKQTIGLNITLRAQTFMGFVPFLVKKASLLNFYWELLFVFQKKCISLGRELIKVYHHTLLQIILQV